MRLNWLLWLPAVLSTASALAIQKRDAEFFEVRTHMHKDMSGRRGDPAAKYFHESVFHPHYDGRFADKQLGYQERKHALSNLIQTYLATFADLGVETWLMHGTLLGWWWNRKILPWDSDSDVQVSESSMHFLASYYNMSVFHYKTPRIPEGRDYMLEVNPHYVNREQSDKMNVIDARWIDTASGLFIDITTVRYNHTHPAGKGMLSCKDGHEFRDTYIFPLRDTFFEGTPAKIPFAYKEVLESEYQKKALTLVDYEGHHFDDAKLEWIPVHQQIELGKKKSKNQPVTAVAGSRPQAETIQGPKPQAGSEVPLIQQSNIQSMPAQNVGIQRTGLQMPPAQDIQGQGITGQTSPVRYTETQGQLVSTSPLGSQVQNPPILLQPQAAIQPIANQAPAPIVQSLPGQNVAALNPGSHLLQSPRAGALPLQNSPQTLPDLEARTQLTKVVQDTLAQTSAPLNMENQAPSGSNPTTPVDLLHKEPEQVPEAQAKQISKKPPVKATIIRRPRKSAFKEHTSPWHPPSKLRKAEDKFFARQTKRLAKFRAMENKRRLAEQKSKAAANRRLAYEKAHTGKGRIASHKVRVKPTEPHPAVNALPVKGAKPGVWTLPEHVQDRGH